MWTRGPSPARPWRVLGMGDGYASTGDGGQGRLSPILSLARQQEWDSQQPDQVQQAQRRRLGLVAGSSGAALAVFLGARHRSRDPLHARRKTRRRLALQAAWRGKQAPEERAVASDAGDKAAEEPVLGAPALRYGIIVLGVLGWVPNTFWSNLPDKERGALAFEMVRRRDGWAGWRKAIALSGVAMTFYAFPEVALLASRVPQNLDGFSFYLLLLAIGAAAICFPVVWVAPESPTALTGPLADAGERAEDQLDVADLAAPNCRKEVEALERIWKL